ncbi:hypothetical protein ABW20_dc0110706 [Dactylellina cionopaga]|nr:hypothetical protein ABW20_dc0110706 [Dactylellina cionopaga]
MACGFEDEHEAMRLAIKDACARDIFIFAAASNFGNARHIAFPANMKGDVMCMFACNGHNKVSNFFNPAARKRGDNFAFLGEDIKAYPGDKGRNGTSYSTFLGAAVAGLLLDFARQGDVQAKIQNYARLKRMDGMSSVFLEMAEHATDGNYSCVVPWEFVRRYGEREKEREQICRRLSVALERVS